MLSTLENLIKLARERKLIPVEGSYTNKLLTDKPLSKAKVLEEVDELIEAIDEETAKELITRSKETLIKEKEAVALKLKELGVDDKLINLKGMTQGMLVILGQKNIKKLRYPREKK